MPVAAGRHPVATGPSAIQPREGPGGAAVPPPALAAGGLPAGAALARGPHSGSAGEPWDGAALDLLAELGHALSDALDLLRVREG